MRILLLSIADDADSRALAEMYTQVHDDISMTWLEVERNFPSDRWIDSYYNSMKYDDFISSYAWPLYGETYDFVILSMNFPIRLYGGSDDNMSEAERRYITEVGGQGGLEYFLSSVMYPDSRVFRLDGSSDFNDMIDWMNAINQDVIFDGMESLVFDADSGLGIAYNVENNRYITTFQDMQIEGWPVIFDSSPDPANLNGASIAGWFGWYDPMPENYFTSALSAGAVGWQARSTTFRKRDNSWCCSMIKDGHFAGTIGACYEPGIYAFPEPEAFCHDYFVRGVEFGVAAWDTTRDHRRLCFICDPLFIYGDHVADEPNPNPAPQPPDDPWDPPAVEPFVPEQDADGNWVLPPGEYIAGNVKLIVEDE